jgi:hypothetical protein
MSTRKTLLLTSLVLIFFPLRHAEPLIRVADDCKCDRSQLSCKILCSGIGSNPGTGGGSSTFDVGRGADRAAEEKPIIVPKTEMETKSPSERDK